MPVPITAYTALFPAKRILLSSSQRLKPSTFARVHAPAFRHLSTTMGAPVILCGKTEQIGKGVIETLKPEFEGRLSIYPAQMFPVVAAKRSANVQIVVHFVMTPESGKEQIPAIFRGETPSSRDSELGTKDYSQKPAAVILGGGYDDAGIEVMMDASKGIHPVPWLRPDLSLPAPPLGPEYGKALVQRIKEKLAVLEKEGQMSEEKVVWY